MRATEEQAKALKCCGPVGDVCRGAKCMAWGWTGETTLATDEKPAEALGFCGLAGQGGEKPAPEVGS